MIFYLYYYSWHFDYKNTQGELNYNEYQKNIYIGKIVSNTFVIPILKKKNIDFF